MDAIAGSFSYPLVAISIAAAILSSYVALELAVSADVATRKPEYQRWLGLSALALGLGIWTMHFIGMLSYQLPLPVVYDGLDTLLSLVIAVIASFLGFSIVNRESTPVWVVIGGACMGLGIAGMHYLGMAGMRLPADMSYDSGLVLLSIVIAIVVASLALWLLVTMKAGLVERSLQVKILIASLMGAAIASMHYTGMAALRLVSNPMAMPVESRFVIDSEAMATTLSVAAILLILFLLYVVSYENRFSRRLGAELQLLRANEARLRTLIENAPDAFFVYNDQGSFLDVNKVACEQLGYKREELLASSIFDIEDRQEGADTVKLIWPFLKQGEGVSTHGYYVRKDGSKFPVDVNITGLQDNGKPQMFALARDVTETEKLKEYLSKLAMTDELTGLYNRRAFMISLEKELTSARRYGTPVSIMMLDIDYFKKINDVHGHHVGDITLQAFASIVERTIRNEDTMGRLGGEEFAIVMANTGIDSAKVLAERVRAAVENHEIPFSGGIARITVSIGLSHLGSDTTAKTLIDNADKALYAAKGAGRNRVLVHQES